MAGRGRRRSTLCSRSASLLSSSQASASSSGSSGPAARGCSPSASASLRVCARRAGMTLRRVRRMRMDRRCARNAAASGPIPASPRRRCRGAARAVTTWRAWPCGLTDGSGVPSAALPRPHPGPDERSRSLAGTIRKVPAVLGAEPSRSTVAPLIGIPVLCVPRVRLHSPHSPLSASSAASACQFFGSLAFKALHTRLQPHPYHPPCTTRSSSAAGPPGFPRP